MIAPLLAVAIVTATTTVHEGPKTHGHHEPSAMQESAPPRTIDKGTQSGIEDAKQVVVRTESEWTKFWQQHAPARKQPAVDFSKEMVVGVFMGSRPSAGFSVSIAGTSTKDGSLLVRYQESLPEGGMMRAQLLTFPFHLVAVPKRAGDVTFEKAP